MSTWNILGFKETDDTYEVFAKSKSDVISINQLDGVLILPKDKSKSLIPIVTKKKKFVIGLSGDLVEKPKKTKKVIQEDNELNRKFKMMKLVPMAKTRIKLARIIARLFTQAPC